MSTRKYHTSAKTVADKYFPTPSPSPLAAEVTPSLSPAQAPTKMSKLSELSAALAAIPQAVEAEADKALTRLTAAKDAAFNGIGKIHDVAEKIEGSAKEIEDFTNQITNGGPPL